MSSDVQYQRRNAIEGGSNAEPWHSPRLPLAFCAGFVFSSRTIFVLFTGRWLNIGTDAGVLAGFALDAALATIAALGALGAREDGAAINWTSGPLRWVILYLAFSGCSFLWTASVSPRLRPSTGLR